MKTTKLLPHTGMNTDQNKEETKEYIKLLIQNLKAGDTNPWC